MNMIRAHRVLVGAIGCIVALVVAGIYLVVIPEQAAEAPAYAQPILRYGHSLCWILLAIASVLFAMKRSAKLVVGFAYVALISYGAFMVTFLITKI